MGGEGLEHEVGRRELERDEISVPDLVLGSEHLELDGASAFEGVFHVGH